MVANRRRAPEVFLSAVSVEYLCGELTSSANAAEPIVDASAIREHWSVGGICSRHIAVDDLDGRSRGLRILRKEIENLRLHAGMIQRLPLQVLSLQFRVGRRLGLFRDRLDGRGAIDRFMGASHMGKSAVGNNSTSVI